MKVVSETEFVAGLELSKTFFEEIVQPLLKEDFAALNYSAALLGDGSEVLGYDTPISMDHDWGPRVQIFLEEADFKRDALSLLAILDEKLPSTFRNHPTSFPDPDRPVEADFESGCLGSSRFGIEIYSYPSACKRILGWTLKDEISTLDWLGLTQQRLLGFTSGQVFHDPSGILENLRTKLSWYPEDVWLYLLSCQWARIAQEQAFVGRCGDVQDENGSQLIAMRLLEAAMQLCFFLERKYAPYSKWFGTAFSRLDCFPIINEQIQLIHHTSNWKERQEALCELFQQVGYLHQSSNVPGAITPQITGYFDRPYQVINADEFIQPLRSQIKDEKIKSLPLTGSIDQLTNNHTLLCDRVACRKLVEGLYSDLLSSCGG